MKQSMLIGFSLAAACGAVGISKNVLATESGAASQRHLRADPGDATHEDHSGVLKQLRFDQKLLICNAYPSNSSMMVRKNDQEDLVESKQGISFRECRYVASQLQPHDRLDLEVKDQEIHGTFEVGELPTSDAVLLLVLERHVGSSLVSFQSFAFPTSHDTKEAQLAVIDAFRLPGSGSADTKARLKMEDHIKAKEKQTVSRRVEQLNFNRVYGIEEGTYDASVGETARRVLKLERNQNYVVLRTGDPGFGEAESLVVFPDAELKSHACGFALPGVMSFVSLLTFSVLL